MLQLGPPLSTSMGYPQCRAPEDGCNALLLVRPLKPGHPCTTGKHLATIWKVIRSQRSYIMLPWHTMAMVAPNHIKSYFSFSKSPRSSSTNTKELVTANISDPSFKLTPEQYHRRLRHELTTWTACELRHYRT